MKATFCKEGNRELRKLADEHCIPIREVGIVVFARNKYENLRLESQSGRGVSDGLEIEIHGLDDLYLYEPLAKSHHRFLWSPTTTISYLVAKIDALRNKSVQRGAHDFWQIIRSEWSKDVLRLLAKNI